MRVNISNIKWDFSDTSKPYPKLPKNITVEINVEDENDEEEVEHELNEHLANEYGFCSWGFSYIVVKPIIQQAGE